MEDEDDADWEVDAYEEEEGGMKEASGKEREFPCGSMGEARITSARQ